MTTQGWLQLLFLLALLAVSTPLFGAYMAKVYGGGKAPGDRFFNPIERVIYKLSGVNPDREQRWTSYALSLLGFSLASLLILYAQLRLQGHLPLNPNKFMGVTPALSFNTAISFLTNTNWQNYSGESTMSMLSQMGGLAFHNFVSAAAGAAVAIALIRGLVRRRSTHHRQLLGRPGAHLPAGAAAVRVPRHAGPHQPGRHPELPRQQDRHHGDGPAADHHGRADRLAGGHQGGRRERRRPLQRQLDPPLREPQRHHQHHRDLGPPGDPVRLHLHVRQAGRRQEAGLGGLRRHDVPLPAHHLDHHADRGPGQPEAHGRRRHPDGHGHPGRRQHGGQGHPLRPHRVRAVRLGHHPHLHRCGRLRPRQPAPPRPARCRSPT